MKCVLAYQLDIYGNSNFHKVLAITKCFGANNFERLGHYYRLKLLTIGKSVFAYNLYAFGKFYAGKACAERKEIFSYLGNRILPPFYLNRLGNFHIFGRRQCCLGAYRAVIHNCICYVFYRHGCRRYAFVYQLYCYCNKHQYKYSYLHVVSNICYIYLSNTMQQNGFSSDT